MLQSVRKQGDNLVHGLCQAEADGEADTVELK
jgi:hypothetical protein